MLKKGELLFELAIIKPCLFFGKRNKQGFLFIYIDKKQLLMIILQKMLISKCRNDHEGLGGRVETLLDFLWSFFLQIISKGEDEEMDLKLIVPAHKCETEVFTINGIEADYKDFGEKYDDDPDSACMGGCGNMIFAAKKMETKIMEKYQINEKEYEEIIKQLQEQLSFGECYWCG